MQKMLFNKILMLSLFLVFASLSEIFMFTFLGEGIVPSYILLNICFLVLIGSVIFLIPSNKFTVMYLTFVLILQCVLNVVNCVMYENCGDVFSILYVQLFGEAKRVFEFNFLNLGKISAFIGLLVLFVTICIILIKKKLIGGVEKEKYFSFLKKQILGLIAIIVVFSSTYIIQISLIKANNEEDVFSDSYLYSSLNLKVEGLKKFGTWGYYTKEVQKLLFSSSSASGEIKEAVNTYLSNGEYKKSDYFGLMEGKNVIMIMMESVQWFAFDEHLTPNIYNLINGGLTFSNYHSKNKTNVSEMIGITGSYPAAGNLDPYDIDYNFLNSLPNNLSDEYISTYVHPNTGSFYKREALIPQLGFDKSYFYEDLFPGEALYEWGDFVLDSVTMEASLPYLVPNDSKFYSFFTTLSTHGPYNKNIKNIELLSELGYFESIDAAVEGGQWENPLSGSDVEESFRYYKAMAMDLDKAIGILIEELEEKELLDDTVIVLYGDHNAYYDDIVFKIYDSSGGEYYKPYVFKTPLIIYNEELSSEYKVKNNIRKENAAEITKFVSTYNIVPTLLDLLGCEFNSNLYLGDSVLIEEDFERNNIFFSLQGGIFNDKIYTINGHDVVYTELEEYDNELEVVRNASRLFLTKMKYIEYIYNYNMFDDIVIDLEME